jgi:DNA repair exonuclease SbcCD ATPase subunit
MLLCGCNPKQREAENREDAAKTRRPDVPLTAPATRAPMDPAAQRAHIAELQTTMNTLQFERDSAQLKQTRAQAQLETHQRDSQALLASLKSRSAAQRDPPTAEQFAEQARSQLEHALSMDQEYMAQLEEANAEVAKLDARLEELGEDLRASQLQLDRAEAKTANNR